MTNTATTVAQQRAQATRDDRMAPLAAPQPLASTVGGLPTVGDHVNPLLRWNGQQLANMRQFGATGAIFAGAAIIIVGVLVGLLPIPLLTSGSGNAPISIAIASGIGVVALALIGLGVWARVGGWRANRLSKWMCDPLTVTANADGLAWEDPAWRTRQQMRLAWRNVRSFSVATYQREPNESKWRVYILDGDATRLLWALPFFPSAEQSAVHNRLAGLIVGATGLPLRDITPGLDALGAAIRSANPLLQTKAEKAFAATQPIIPGVPIRAMRRWAYGFYSVLAASLVVTLAYGALSIVAWFVH